MHYTVHFMFMQKSFNNTVTVHNSLGQFNLVSNKWQCDTDVIIVLVKSSLGEEVHTLKHHLHAEP